MVYVNSTGSKKMTFNNKHLTGKENIMYALETIIRLNEEAARRELEKKSRPHNIKVENINGTVNQFLIQTSEGLYFQSYNNIIAFKPLFGKTQLDSYYWDYSRTTGKYRNQFLGENKAETKRKIKAGIYKLTDLN